MAVTNPDKVVTKQDLADFYDQIKPYLGSYPVAIANKFSKSDIYSTSEKVIGQWQDGKPIYQKVITSTIPNCTENGAEATSSVDIGATISEVVNASGCYFTSGNYVPLFTRPLNTVAPTEWSTVTLRQIRFMVNTNSASSDKNKVIIKNSNPQANGATCRFIVQYTKTTDNAVSIGEETEYSTSEKIVGTWIDGRPIYQKTIDFGSLPNNDSKRVAHGISNLAHVYNISGIAVTSANTSALTIPDTFNNNFTEDVVNNPSVLNAAMRILVTVDGYIQIFTNGNRSTYNAYVTLQYTKTS